jgi:hypothetical protein
MKMTPFGISVSAAPSDCRSPIFTLSAGYAKHNRHFNTLEIQFLFLKNEFREGTYTPLWGACS